MSERSVNTSKYLVTSHGDGNPPECVDIQCVAGQRPVQK